MPPIAGSIRRIGLSSGLGKLNQYSIGLRPAHPAHDSHDQQHPEDQQADCFKQDKLTAAIQITRLKRNDRKQHHRLNNAKNKRHQQWKRRQSVPIADNDAAVHDVAA